MERFFRSLKTEWVREYELFQQMKVFVMDYIIGYYSQVRPHRHIDGLALNTSEEKYWKEYKTVAKIICLLQTEYQPKMY